MAPVLDATLAGTESNSYVTLADADAIAGNLPFYAEWAATPDEDRTIALIISTNWLETLAYISNPSSFPDTGGGGSAAPTGTYVKRQKLDVLEIEYDEFSNPESSSCDSCGDPIIAQAFPWLADLLGCWASGIATGDNKMIRLFRN